MITPIKKTSFLFATIVFALALVFNVSAQAQQSTEQPEGTPTTEEFNSRFEDDALVNFFDVNRELSEVNKETQDKMAEAARTYDLTLERFNQIANANRIGALQGGNFTEAEIEAFNNLGPQISQIQREHQQKVQATLEERGFTSASYQEILTEYRTDQDLQAYVRDLLRERRRQEILEERRRAAEEGTN
jgi:LAS superfamily LD-carboxypeptidase LdcB